MEESFNFDITFKQLRRFFELTKQESFSQYAHYAGIGRQQVTNLVKDLESKLDCKLFNSGPHRVPLTLTEQGKLLLEFTEEIDKSFKRLKTALEVSSDANNKG